MKFSGKMIRAVPHPENQVTRRTKPIDTGKAQQFGRIQPRLEQLLQKPAFDRHTGTIAATNALQGETVRKYKWERRNAT